MLLENAIKKNTKSKSEKPAVTLVYAFGWAHEVLRTLHGLFGEAILSSLLFSGMAMTTHFAGTGAAELAGHFLEAASVACIAPLRLRYVAACESSVRCQSHLREVLQPGSCIMVDILDRCPAAKSIFERFWHSCKHSEGICCVLLLGAGWGYGGERVPWAGAKGAKGKRRREYPEAGHPF